MSIKFIGFCYNFLVFFAINSLDLRVLKSTHKKKENRPTAVETQKQKGEKIVSQLNIIIFSHLMGNLHHYRHCVHFFDFAFIKKK